MAISEEQLQAICGSVRKTAQESHRRQIQWRVDNYYRPMSLPRCIPERGAFIARDEQGEGSNLTRDIIAALWRERNRRRGFYGRRHATPLTGYSVTAAIKAELRILRAQLGREQKQAA